MKDFCADLTEEEAKYRYKLHQEEDLGFIAADDLHNSLVKCQITEYKMDEVAYKFSSPYNITIFFSNPLQLAENLVSKHIIDYVMYNVEDDSVQIKVEAKCDAYRNIDTWRTPLWEIKRLIRKVHREEDYSHEFGYFLNFFNDGVLLTLVTRGEAHRGEQPEETRAAIFLCKPEPEKTLDYFLIDM